jgi:hypothetical protein
VLAQEVHAAHVPPEQLERQRQWADLTLDPRDGGFGFRLGAGENLDRAVELISEFTKPTDQAPDLLAD